jgi:hypothetical protein
VFLSPILKVLPMRFLSCCLALTLVSPLLGGSPEALFNGTDLNGWTGRPANWSVEDGAITGRTTAENPLKENTFLVWDGEVADFELTLQYRIDGGNSGVQYRSKIINAEKFVVGGYQADIDSKPRYTGINYEEKGRGILAERGQIVAIDAEGKKAVVGSSGDKDALMSLISPKDWNRYRIVAKGPIVQHYINDVLMSEVQDGQTSKAAKSGKVALQIHVGEPMKVQFKDLKLTKLP